MTDYDDHIAEAKQAEAVCKHVSRLHGTDEFWPHPRTGGRRLTLAPDGLFSLAAPVREPSTGPVVERLSEPTCFRPLEPKYVLTNTEADGRHRDAAHAYRRAGETSRAQHGRFDSRTLDAFEGMARVISKAGAAANE